ncbi:MAG TPA: hypothetical protein VLR27_10055 [Acidimicrobiales bacterium]|nr:hypothetical protein [Acidimicrobiales bacterium]
MPKNNTTTIRRRAAAVAACLLALGLAACGDDDDAAADETPTTEAVDNETETETGDESDDAPEGEVVEVTAVDWAFEGLPASVEAGTKLSLTNEGEEPHELVAMRIPDEETRPISELMALPEDELFPIFGDGEPAAVILAATGTTDTPGPVVGDGTLTEPGRYAIVCFLPVGADDSILDPEADGPPESDAPPHVSQGMFAELTVS